MYRVEEFSYLTLNTRWAFIQLRQAFIKTPILQDFDTEHYIRIKTDAFGYAISSILSQMILETGQYHSVVCYSRKIILAKTRYKTHNVKLIAIVEAFNN